MPAQPIGGAGRRQEITMVESGVPKKLRIKTGQRALILNSPEEYIEGFAALLEGVQIDQDAKGEYEFVQVFVVNSGELEELMPTALDAVVFDGLLWVSYPKGSSGVETDLNRDILWDKLLSKGIRPVTQVSIDEVWSAIRFRPTEQVGKK
jgi:hypothetical protein